MRTDKINIDEFVRYHNSNYFYYCEVIIHPDGDVSYCIPSHRDRLIAETGLSKEEVWSILDIWDDVLLRLVEMTNCVAVTYDLYVSPSDISSAQFISLDKLVTNACIDPRIRVDSRPGYHHVCDN